MSLKGIFVYTKGYSLEKVVNSKPSILSHNIETVERVFKEVRPQGDYRRSLKVLRFYSESKVAPVKSGIMLGFGESWEDILRTIEDLRKVGVSILVIGQYLRPSPKHYPVKKLYHEEDFKKLEEIALEMGFEVVLSKPLARSSYHAEEIMRDI